MNRNIIVIGGGPSGLEASAQLHKMGYNVILVEQSNELGGHLAKWDRLFPSGENAQEVLKELKSNLEGVKYFLKTKVDTINKLDKSYNVILSNGITVLAEAVLMATGFDIFKAEKKEEYGYGVYNNVITNEDLEQFFKTKKDSRVVENPKRIGFVHCVGSRDEKAGNKQCSKVCCATAVKQACEIKELYPEADVFCFYMDLRMFGRKYEDLYLKAQKEFGVRFIRGRVSEVSETIDKQIVIKAEDTLAAKPIRVTLDLLVLMSGMCPNKEGKRVGELISLKSDEDGFFELPKSMYNQQITKHVGLFMAGACTGPKTIPEAINEGRSAAISIHNYLTQK